ncbi:MAG: DNA translocase FtsK 4TM domain-containing protein, partial [Geminicoccales bacterium]
MARATRSHPQAGIAGHSIARALREGALWVFGALALILLVALASYDPTDPGFSFVGDTERTQNAIGPAGAWTADLFFLLFGRPSYLFPLMLVYAGWLIYRRREDGEPMTRGMLAFRTAGFVLTLATSAGLATLHFSPAALPNTAGGILGDLVGNGLARVLSFLGATVLLLALWLAGVSLFLGISWFAIIDVIGRTTLRLLGAVRSSVGAAELWVAGRRVKQLRQESVREKKKVAARREPPRIEPVISSLEISERVEKERQVPLFEPAASGELPPLSVLDDPPPREGGYSPEALEAMSRLVELKLNDFGIEVEVVAVHP